MTTTEVSAIVLFSISAAGALAVFVIYPLVLRCAGGHGALPRDRVDAQVSGITMIVAVRNGEALVDAKVRNSLALRAPGPLDFVFVSDGSSDATVERLRAAGSQRLRVVELARHLGKADALNEGARLARGEILVFSDADALLEEEALLRLIERFSDPEVGGVCGQRVIRDRQEGFAAAQRGYVAADSVVKRLEARLGSVTSNDGKLYAIRRELHRPIAPGATDDLFACLSVVEQGRRFVFEPEARASIPRPSRDARHELSRRRRIVARSLHGIALKRGLLNPIRHGCFSIQLLVNKVLRRLLPLFVAGLLVSSLVLAGERPWARLAVAAQLAFFVLAALHGRGVEPTRLRALSSLAWYFCVGNLGTLLGLVDFLGNRVTVKWDPIKGG